MKKRVYALMIVLWLVAACGTGELPTQPPVPPTDPSPTATTMPPTGAPIPPTGEPGGTDLYLGQIPPGLEVEIFAPGIVSIEEGKEYKITFSPDLQEVFFTRRTPNGRNDRIWYTRLENGTLTIPELASFAYDSLEMDPSFTPDGNRVYYNSWRPLPGEDALSGRSNVWFVDRIESGWSEPQFLGPPINDYRPVYFSFADDNTLYFTNSNPREIWYAEWVDGQYAEAQRLPDEINDLPNVAHPAVAPDESYIVVDSYDRRGGALVGSLYVSFRKPDGSWTEAVSLADALSATETDIYASARITPDGRYLFFERYLPGTDQADIYWVSTAIVEGCRSQVLQAEPTTAPAPPTATPLPPLSGSGGGVIAFNLPAAAGYNSDIYAINVADALQDTQGSFLRRLTRHPANDFDPVWSPDGTHIAFVSERDYNQEIYVMNVADALEDTDENALRRLTDNQANDHSPTWSPDGAHVAFASDRDGDEEIYVVNADGGGLQRLTDNDARDTAPDWSADGSQIAFESNRDGRRQIYVMQADGSHQRRLTNSDASDYSPAWSPDGTQIAFHSSRDGGWKIFVMNRDGSDPRRLTNNEGQAADPVWSPDGTQILYSIHNAGKDPGLYIVNADGRNSRFLPATIGGYQHDWHPFDTSPTAASSQTNISAGTVDRIVRPHALGAHPHRVRGLGFSSDGHLLASGNWDATIRLWDVETWQETRTFDHRGGGGVYWTAGDALLVMGDGKIGDVASGQEVHTLDSRACSGLPFRPMAPYWPPAVMTTWCMCGASPAKENGGDPCSSRLSRRSF